MNELELQERILKGEGLHTEFKVSFTNNEEFAKSITSFANTDGGEILVGINNNGEIVGVENIDELLRKIDDVAYNRCEPPVTIVQETLSIENKIILIVKIPKGDQRPYRTSSGVYYIRSANRTRQASREELLRLFQAAGSLYFDENEIQRASTKDINMDYAKKFLENYFKLSVNDESLIRYLINIKALSNNEKPTFTGILFFGENPQYYIPYGRIITAYIKGDDISIPPSDRKDHQGKIPEILEDTMRFFKAYIKEKHTIRDLESENYPEIEDFVLREALVNSIAHRDYTINAPVRILIYDNRIEFHTPGLLPNTVTIESMKIGGAHVLRNPTIYNLLGKIGLVTDVGSGIKRIIESVKKTVGRDVSLNVVGNEFILTIPRIEG
ncbi:MAG: transcriptional regulator [Candidatus Atribacteria bacterium]|nr:transcriptional regulator [Candidatus Atribacteria bacterium]